MNQTRSAMTQASRTPAGARVGIPPRHVDFARPDAAARYPFAGNAVVTAFHAVLSAIFPPGERFFAESVRRFRDRVTDEQLKAAVSGFMGQEAIHGREHEKLNEWFASLGYDMRVPDRTIRLGLGLLSLLPARQQLACTAFMEHFTARLGQELLTEQELIRQTDPAMLALWQWHALEELEHKAVAYDVYEMLGNRRGERVLAVPLVVAALLPGILASWAWLVARDAQARDLREHGRGLRMLLGRDGFVTRILPKMGVFMRHDFHPARHDTRALVARSREQLFGEGGVLQARWLNPVALAAP